ncbi:MAG TPA: GAF domain-containing protein [Nocardioidaceae bacterium]|nr:GAF domain-containing protein [Nocardioidaceae bacterium]
MGRSRNDARTDPGPHTGPDPGPDPGTRPDTRSDSGASRSDDGALLDAVVAISSDLDLHSVLDRIVVSACRITGARYGALGVLDDAGGLADFVTSGLSPEEHRAIGHLPRGHGILGLLIRRPEPLRLRHLREHPDAVGLPPHHPPMDSFLGVPVRIRGTVFGNLYLTEKAGGAEFTAEDERLVLALANAAGHVVENARAFALSELRRRWLEASALIVDSLQPPVRLDDALLNIAEGARRVARGTSAAVVQASEGEHHVAATDGATASSLTELVMSVEKHVERAERDAELVVVPDAEAGTVVLVPLRARVAQGGVLLVTLDHGRGALAGEEAALFASFADQASLALDRAQAMSEREELMLVADRDRIARDLHDLVIQRLFATGLQLQGVRRIAGSDDLRSRLDAAVADLDVTIRDIRSTIFELQTVHELSLRADVRGVVKEYVPVLGFSPLVRTAGPVDTAVPDQVGVQLLAVLREALSNVARHSGADAAVVEVVVTESEVTLLVTDNGSGLPAERRESGLRNVRRRATDHGGTVRLLEEEPHGTRLEWSVPL